MDTIDGIHVKECANRTHLITEVAFRLMDELDILFELNDDKMTILQS
jgi:hypothetical protein